MSTAIPSLLADRHNLPDKHRDELKRHQMASRLASSDGTFSMISVDHRESLRTMMADRGTRTDVPDTELSRFKAIAVTELAPLVDAVLIDPQYGRRGIEAMPGATKLIVAVDSLTQERGGPVRGSRLNRAIGSDDIIALGADALKLLVVWRSGDEPTRRRDMVAEFIEMCERLGVTSLLEGLVRPPEGQSWKTPEHRDECVLEAASEFAIQGPDIYKAEVPGYRVNDLSRVAEQSVLMTEIVGGPWVVLSSGVRAAEYGNAIALACSSGALGFLAGRAVWQDALAADDYATALRSVSVPRIVEYRRTVQAARLVATDYLGSGSRTR